MLQRRQAVECQHTVVANSGERIAARTRVAARRNEVRAQRLKGELRIFVQIEAVERLDVVETRSRLEIAAGTTDDTAEETARAEFADGEIHATGADDLHGRQAVIVDAAIGRTGRTVRGELVGLEPAVHDHLEGVDREGVGLHVEIERARSRGHGHRELGRAVGEVQVAGVPVTPAHPAVSDSAVADRNVEHQVATRRARPRNRLNVLQGRTRVVREGLHLRAGEQIDRRRRITHLEIDQRHRAATRRIEGFRDTVATTATGEAVPEDLVVGPGDAAVLIVIGRGHVLGVTFTITERVTEDTVIIMIRVFVHVEVARHAGAGQTRQEAADAVDFELDGREAGSEVVAATARISAKRIQLSARLLVEELQRRRAVACRDIVRARTREGVAAGAHGVTIDNHRVVFELAVRHLGAGIRRRITASVADREPDSGLHVRRGNQERTRRNRTGLFFAENQFAFVVEVAVEVGVDPDVDEISAEKLGVGDLEVDLGAGDEDGRKTREVLVAAGAIVARVVDRADDDAGNELINTRIRTGVAIIAATEGGIIAARAFGPEGALAEGKALTKRQVADALPGVVRRLGLAALAAGAQQRAAGGNQVDTEGRINVETAALFDAVQHVDIVGAGTGFLNAASDKDRLAEAGQAELADREIDAARADDLDGHQSVTVDAAIRRAGTAVRGERVRRVRAVGRHFKRVYFEGIRLNVEVKRTGRLRQRDRELRRSVRVVQVARVAMAPAHPTVSDSAVADRNVELDVAKRARRRHRRDILQGRTRVGLEGRHDESAQRIGRRIRSRRRVEREGARAVGSPVHWHGRLAEPRR